ncbi:type II toxin-antitoxin system RelE/ParE family toxin [Candidatus Woesearchaeota archaeon]|nr:type II toxin-antitoxin system RelE/ParE family toxin [Candidatus Woesearchaeota archaeon]
MVIVEFDPEFKKIFSRIKDPALKERIIKQFEKIKENPEIGKPMRYTRKGTREVYVSPFRLSYHYLKEEDKIVLADLYHKDKQ